MKKIVELKIVATGHKLKAEDSLLILIHPQYGQFIDEILNAVEGLTGHRRHTVIPIAQEDIKIFSVKHPITIEQFSPPSPTQ